MRINEILVNEEPVLSSWISDLTLQNNERDVTMALGNGRRYAVYNVGPQNYTAWVRSPSKGKFWHSNIKGKFVVKRLM